MRLTAMTHRCGALRLEPFEERHRDGLVNAAGADPSIFQYMPFPPGQPYAERFDWLRAEQAAGRWIPHAAISPDGEIVGQSCYLNIRPELSCVEIGATWFRRDAQGTAVNPSSKLMLIGHAFDCGAERVELKTDAQNMQSRNAMAKLGLVFEGVMRKQMLRPNGTWRDNAWYSVTREEWPVLRSRIERRLGSAA